MSSQKGNASRTRPQKHQNNRAFKNNLHDTSHTTKMINSINVSNVCQRCKEIIEWKIKYKKYKPLTQPKKCVRCEQKTVKLAYHVMCAACGEKFKVCTKCCEAKEIIPALPSKDDKIKLDNEMQALLKSLPERKRRTFLRYLDKMNQNKPETTTKTNEDKQKEDLVQKLHKLKMSSDNSDDEEFDNFSDDELDFSDSSDD